MIKSMSCTRKGLWSKLGLCFGKKDRHGKEDTSSLKSKSINVNEEYKEAFRTRSYIEMCNKVQSQLHGQQSSSSSSPSPSPSLTSPPLDQHLHLSEYLLEPRQETLNSMLAGSNGGHQFLINYFDTSLEAGRICESLLQNIHRVRINHTTLKNAIKFIERVSDKTIIWTNADLYRNISSSALHKNPFSTMTPEKFQEMHNSHLHLLNKLTSQCRKNKRRAKLTKLIKRGVIIGFGALAVALVLILSMHSIAVAGLAAAPGLVMSSLGFLLMKKLKQTTKERKKSKKQGQGLDIAARGVYILIKDFDTMSRLVLRLRDEMERRKYVAEVCVRTRKNEVLKGVMREFKMEECWFLEQLEELEKQIYLCFVDINRSRRLLVEEIDNSGGVNRRTRVNWFEQQCCF